MVITKSANMDLEIQFDQIRLVERHTETDRCVMDIEYWNNGICIYTDFDIVLLPKGTIMFHTKRTFHFTGS